MQQLRVLSGHVPFAGVKKTLHIQALTGEGIRFAFPEEPAQPIRT